QPHGRVQPPTGLENLQAPYLALARLSLAVGERLRCCSCLFLSASPSVTARRCVARSCCLCQHGTKTHRTHAVSRCALSLLKSLVRVEEKRPCTRRDLLGVARNAGVGEPTASDCACHLLEAPEVVKFALVE